MKKILQSAILALVTTFAQAVTCPTFSSGDLTYITKLNQLASGCTAASPSTGSFTSLTLIGTAGAGYVEYANQSAAPGTPTSAGRVFVDSFNRWNFKGTNGFLATFNFTGNAADRIYTWPDAAGTVVIDTATQTLTNKTLTTPNIGVATATSINKVAITAPATSATLTVANGKTLTASNTLTLAGTDSTVMTFPSTSATVARTDAANTFTGVQTLAGNLTFSGTGPRITADMSNATITSRLAMQSSTVNGNTVLHIVPNGSSSISSFTLEGDSAMTNGSVGQVTMQNGTSLSINSNLRGSGTAVPITLVTAATERFRVDAIGNIGLGGAASVWQTQALGTAVVQSGGAAYAMISNAPNISQNLYYDGAWKYYASSIVGGVYAIGGAGHNWYNAPSGTANSAATLTNVMRLDTSGNLGIGKTPATLLDVNGPIATTIATKTSTPYTVAATDSSLIVNVAGTMTLTLPTASSFTGRWLTLRTISANTVVSATSNVVPAAGGAAGTAILAATAGKWASLQSDGTNWQIMMSN